MRVLAIDPGTTESGWVLYDGKVIDSGVSQNEALIDQLAHEDADLMAVEMIASYGMAVGREVFETCVWIGRFIQAAPIPHKLITRQKVKLHVCKSPKAKDTNIRQALIDNQLLGLGSAVSVAVFVIIMVIVVMYVTAFRVKFD